MKPPNKALHLLLFSIFPAVLAQDYALESPSQFEAPAAFREMAATQQRQRLTPGPAYATPNPFFSWGNITMRPHVSARYLYNSGLLTAPGSARTESHMGSLSPGLLFQLGPRWTLDYTPSLNFYSNSRYDDTVNHNLALQGSTAYKDWRFTLGQSYSRTADPLIETAAQTDQEVFNTRLGASYYFNNKLHLEASLSQSIRSTDAFSNSRAWSTMEWLNYQIAPTLALGLGLGAGYDDVEASADMAHERILGRISSHITEKLSLSVSGGGEIRQIIGSGADSLINPIYNASITHTPFDYTTLTLTGSRAIRASLFAGQISESSVISLAMNQRLLGVVYLTLSGAYRNTSYLLSNASLTNNRTDDSWTFLSRLSYPFSQRAALSTFYQYSSNQSSDSSFAFHNTQIGVELSYQF